MTAESLESRLRRLEILLGTETISSHRSSKSIEEQLDDLERRFYNSNTSSTSATNSSTSSILTMYQEIDKLMDELSAGTALTHQNVKNVAPILYRKQEIMASAEQFKVDMDNIAMILNTILIDNNNAPSSSATTNSNTITTKGGSATTTNTNNTIISGQQVVNAPILIQYNTSINMEQRTKIETLSNKVMELNNRMTNASKQVDYMVYYYYQLIESISQKLILMNDTITTNNKM